MSERDLSDLLSVDEAIEIIDATPVEPRILDVPLQEVQGARVVHDLHADRDYPPFDKALMDGFAVRCADVAKIPAELTLVGEVPAGGQSTRAIQRNQAIAIMTGAPMPPGADGVVPVEDVENSDVQIGTNIRVIRQNSPGRYIARAGADIRAGMLVLPAGTKLEAAQIAVAASVGAARVKIYAWPRVSVISTGDEIVPMDRTPGPTQIRGCNGIMLTSLLRRLGCRPVDLGLVPDRPDLIRKALVKGMQLDALVISGGMSMGKYDFVPRLLRELGAELKITKLRIKPGKPFVFATIDRAVLNQRLSQFEEMPIQGSPGGTCYIFGLPGNPVSGFVCTLRLASRLLDRLAGGKPEERWLVGKLASSLPPNGPREFYQPAKLEFGGDGVVVHPMQWKGSADIFTLASANGLLLRPENEPELPEGQMVRVMEM